MSARIAAGRGFYRSPGFQRPTGAPVDDSVLAPVRQGLGTINDSAE